MFHCPAILLALAMSVGISEAYVLPPPGPGSSDVCHIAQSHSSSLHSLLGLCDGVSSSASDQCTIPTVEILKPCTQGGLMDVSCSRNSILQILSRRSERECICGGLQSLVSMSRMLETMMCPDNVIGAQSHLSESGEMSAGLREFGCTICENVIQDVDNFLTSHTTEEQISSFVQGLCGRQHGIIETLCNTFIAANLPHLINHFVLSQLITTYLAPRTVCWNMGACPAPANTAPVAEAGLLAVSSCDADFQSADDACAHSADNPTQYIDCFRGQLSDQGVFGQDHDNGMNECLKHVCQWLCSSQTSNICDLCIHPPNVPPPSVGEFMMKEPRAFGPFAWGNYWYQFNDQSKDLLEDFSLNGRSLWRDPDVNPTSETIGWSQFSRCWWWCEEEYLLVDYYKDGNKENQVFKVFVAKAAGTPPNRISMDGYQGDNDARLHFGYLYMGGDAQIFVFVIQPRSWYPYQHRFKTSSITAFFNANLSRVSAALTALGVAAATEAAVAGTSAAAAVAAATGAAVGSVVPVIGTIVGAVAGAAVAMLTDDYFGDFLRYIG